MLFRFAQLLLALRHVHGKAVLHRDLKSQNVFLAEGVVHLRPRLYILLLVP